jgi:peroxiredoxin
MIACLGGLGRFCWQLLQQNGRLLHRLDAEGPGTGSRGGAAALPPLAPGTAAPAFAGQDLHGEPVSLDSLLRPGRPVALFFTDPGCGACQSALDAVARAQRERADNLTVAVISMGSIDRIKEKAAEFGLDRVVPQDDEAIFDAYRVNGVPGVVQIDATGTLSKPVVLGAEAVFEAVLGTAAEPPRESVGLAAR